VVCLPVALVLWLPLGIAVSLLVGVGYGFFVPLIATFEATGDNAIDKLSHYFLVIVFYMLVHFFFLGKCLPNSVFKINTCDNFGNSMVDIPSFTF
jgi:hypothetical protein